MASKKNRKQQARQAQQGEVQQVEQMEAAEVLVAQETTPEVATPEVQAEVSTPPGQTPAEIAVAEQGQTPAEVTAVEVQAPPAPDGAAAPPAGDMVVEAGTGGWSGDPAAETAKTVLVFVRSEAVPPIVEQAIEIGARTVWMQEGIVNLEAAEHARAAGLGVVMDRCMRNTWQRLLAPR